ncbi:hypothetical protein HY251_13935 [bacterium]|nr:hypothetical protein [bacterium]
MPRRASGRERTDKPGATIVVLFEGEGTAALVSSTLAREVAFSELTGEKAEAAISACRAGSPGWYRPAETIALSREEASVLSRRRAGAAAKAAGLDAATTERLTALCREACVRVFEREDPASAASDAASLERAIRVRWPEEVDGILRELALPEDQALKVRKVLAREP